MNSANILSNPASLIPHRISRNMLTHHFIGLVLFTVYGIAVCPFLEEMNRLSLIAEVALVFLMVLLVQGYFCSWTHTLNRVFGHGLLAFFVGGLLLALGNAYFYGYPTDSGVKVMIGMILLGAFISADLALDEQYKQSLERVNQISEKIFEKPHSVVWVIQVSTFTLITAIVTVFLLMIVKDLEWLGKIGESVRLEEAFRGVLIETGFLFMVSLGYAGRIIYSYSKNLRLSFDNQISILNEVSEGKRSLRVPVIRNDELGTIAQHTNQMIKTLGEKEEEVFQTRDVAILGLASLAEARDNETGAHILRTQHYVKTLAEHLAVKPEYSNRLTPQIIENLFKSAPLHDVGKVGIPDRILLKEGKLTKDEFEIMKKHAEIGADALRKAESDLDQGLTVPFLQFAVEIAETHHEKWDGLGYPKGLAGEEIPLSGRLMALADVYDALINKRVYKPAFSHVKAKEIILQGRGSHFDPALVDAFIACEEQFIDIAKKFQNEE